MSFNLRSHLEDHSAYFKEYSVMSAQDKHFNFSFLDLQFLEKDSLNELKKLLEKLKLPTSYRVANGIRKLKSGKLVQKFTTRPVNLSKDIKVEAIHLIGSDNEDTMPHIHLIHNKNARFGNSYSLLKQHIATLAKKQGLIPNFDEITEYNPLSVKNLSISVGKMTWSWKTLTAQSFKKIDEPFLNKSIDLLKEYTLKTNNLSYYIKSMNVLQKRINKHQLNFFYEGHALKNTYPLLITKDDLDVIKLIKDKNFSKKSMASFFTNAILRDFIRYSSGTSKPFIINTLKQQTYLLEGVYQNKRAVNIYKDLMDTLPVNRKSDVLPTISKAYSYKSDLRQHVLEAVGSSSSQKKLESTMISIGYDDFKFHKKNTDIIGCKFYENKQLRTFTLHELGINMLDIKTTLNKNKGLNELPSCKGIKSKVMKDEVISPISLVPELISFEYKSKKIKDRKAKLKTTSKERRDDEAATIKRLNEDIKRKDSLISRLNGDTKTLIGRRQERDVNLPKIHKEILLFEREEALFNNRTRGLRDSIRDIGEELELEQTDTTRRVARGDELKQQSKHFEERIGRGRKRNGELIGEIEELERQQAIVSNMREEEIKRHKPSSPGFMY